MRRLYYLAGDLHTTRAVSVRLHAEGITDWNFHVLARDPDGLYSHHIHSALPHHHKDLIRSGELGVLCGGLVGLITAALFFLLIAPSWLAGWFDVGLFTVLGALLGGLVGVRLGLKRDNHRLASFHDDIERGSYLIMVDVRKEDKAQIRELMNMEFSSVAYRGNDSTLVRPFKSDRIYPAEMHQQPGDLS